MWSATQPCGLGTAFWRLVLLASIPIGLELGSWTTSGELRRGKQLLLLSVANSGARGVTLLTGPPNRWPGSYSIPESSMTEPSDELRKVQLKLVKDALKAAQEPQSDDGKEKSQANRLIELAASAELFHTRDKRVYATFPVGDHRETCALKSTTFRLWLTKQF